ncbi:MAG: flagellar hook capping FlgD N-terminal domain-containing protein [Verrucomicrobiota bacterium]
MTSAITSTQQATAYSTQEPPRAPNATLNGDDFLKLLSVQMTNQDPMEPMKDTEFIAQMASFTSLEQMKDLSASFEAFTEDQRVLAVQNYLGREVTATGANGPIQGTVDTVGRDNEGYYLDIGAARVRPENVTEVRIPAPAEA